MCASQTVQLSIEMLCVFIILNCRVSYCPKIGNIEICDPSECREQHLPSQNLIPQLSRTS